MRREESPGFFTKMMIELLRLGK